MNEDGTYRISNHTQIPPILKPHTTAAQRLAVFRERLIQTSARHNRLVNTDLKSARQQSLKCQDVDVDKIWRALSPDKDNAGFVTFLAGETPTFAKLPDEPDDHQLLVSGVDDSKLNSRLLRLMREANLIQRESGIGVLHLALGFLEWYESPTSIKPLTSPLVLLPVTLTRPGVRTVSFKLTLNDVALATNESLRRRMRDDFGLELPTMNHNDDPLWMPTDYLYEVDDAVVAAGSDERWSVHQNIAVLSLFNFTKQRMYYDLLELDDDDILKSKHPFIHNLLSDCFNDPYLTHTRDDDTQRASAPPLSVKGHLLDADPSQARVIDVARSGQSLVVQGPPGTGKSQTIANIIATSLSEGKRVLLVAEKQVALQVVADKLEEAGIRELCLELHSHKMERRNVYHDQFGAALRWYDEQADRYRQGDGEHQLNRAETRLTQQGNALSQISSSLHDPLKPGDYTIYQTLGMLMRHADKQSPSFDLDITVDWNSEQVDEARGRVEAWAETLERVGSPMQHPLRLISNAQLAPPYKRNLERPLRSVIEAMESTDREVVRAITAAKSITKQLGRSDPRFITDNSAATAVRDSVAELRSAIADIATALSPCLPVDCWHGSPHEAIRTLEHLANPPVAAAHRFLTAFTMLDTIADNPEYKSLSQHFADLHERLEKGKVFGRRRAVRQLRRLLGAPDATSVVALASAHQFLTETRLLRSAGRLPEVEMRGALAAVGDTQHVPNKMAALGGFTASEDWKSICAWGKAAVTSEDDEDRQEEADVRESTKNALKAATLLADNQGGWLASLLSALEACRSALLLFDAAGLVDNVNFNESSHSRVVAVVEHLNSMSADCEEIHANLLGRLSPPKKGGARKVESHLLAVDARNAILDLLDEWESLVAAEATARNEFLSCIDMAGLPADRAAIVLGAPFGEVLSAKRRNRLRKALKRVDRFAKKANTTLVDVANHLGITHKFLIPEINSVSQHDLPTPKQRRYIVRTYSKICDHIDDYSDWGKHLRQLHKLNEIGLDAFAKWACLELPSPQHATDSFEVAVGEARLTKHCPPDVADLIRGDRTAMVKAFNLADDKYREECLVSIFRSYVNGFPRSSSPGVREIARLANQTRPRKAVRATLNEHPTDVQGIKPVFLMSPLSVSTYLQSAYIRFDTIIFDEASQVRPEDALPTLQRLSPDGQLIVVGDRQQLPPNTFFDRMTEDRDLDIAEHDDEPLFDVALEDNSILTLCDNQGINSENLLWHYRSRDPSLIAVSNREFYDNRLYLVPASRTVENSGLMFRHVRDGVYDTHKRSNEAEANEIVEAVCHHAKQFVGSPLKKSLGVVTFSQTQADLIEAKLDAKRTTDPMLNEMLGDDQADDVFVKSIENVQGDERDVVLVSVGYAARKDDGDLRLNFGPVNKAGGEKRLNVLFTRARVRCEVFCSFHPSELDLQRGRSEGVRILKEFLSYAQNREDTPVTTGGEYESPFEEDVANVIQELGYEVVPQYGTHNFRIDLAVRHPSRPGEFMLAVEADGATYHRSLMVRERDRLRQQILESYGWSFHRIWSTDWFYDRTATVAILRAALEAAAK